MQNQNDASVELLAELVKERLQDLRRELQQKVELAIQLAACSLSNELAACTSSPATFEKNGPTSDEIAVAAL